MARTRLTRFVREAAGVAREARSRRVAVEQVLEERARDGVTRRDLLRGVAGLAAAGAALRPAARSAEAASARVVVVGAGLAGLTCAYRLAQAGIAAEVYEASDRVGGRCFTRRDAFDEGQIVERGGELIDQSHAAVRQLAKELGLTLDNLLAAEANGTEPAYWFDGAPYSYREASEDMNAIWQTLHKDVSAASYPTLYDNYTPRGYELDHMSIVDWIEASVPGGMASRLGQLLDVAYNIEYGGESSDQSSLNLLYLMGYLGQGQLRIFGPSNEKYHVVGGNDQVPARLAERLAGQIATGWSLAAIRQTASGRYTLTFGSGASAREVTCDRVVLALPFSIMRARVDYRGAGFDERKQWAIAEQGMGTNSKLHVQFTDRHWASLGANGDTFADTGYQNTWDVSRAQPGRSGILVDYTGGLVGASFRTGTPATRARQFLAQVEPVLPGLSAKWNGRATVDYWTGNPYTRGSYSYWKVGQYTRFAGAEREVSGGVHFAGEHTSIDFQGYLNGAVETGERAASEIVAALG